MAANRRQKGGSMKISDTNEKAFPERTTIKVFSFSSTYIEAIGYDAQRELLEVRMISNGKIKRYANVPEEIWYQFRESADPDIYYRRCICGHFPETVYRTRREGTKRTSGAKTVRR